MQIIKPSLRSLSEEQILRAIADGDEDSLVLQELSAIVSSYLKECSAAVSVGKDPSPLFQKEPSCPIEKIAFGMVAAALKAEKKKESS